MTAARRATLACLFTIVIAVTSVLGSTAGAATATPDPGSQVSWSVSPSGPDGPDGRRVIDISLAPGGSVQEHVLVRNLSDHAVTFDITANDGYLTASGKFDMRPRAHVPTEGGAWVQAVDTLGLDAGDSAVVPILLQVPVDATPGDYSAGVAASVVSSNDGLVSTEHRIGVRVNIRVTGDLAPALTLEDLEARYVQSWNPFAPGSVTISSTVANTGNVRLRSELTSSIDPWAGRTRIAAAESPDLTPGSAAVVVVTTEQVWPLGPVRTTVTLHSAVEADSSDGSDAVGPEPVSRSATTWAVPAPQIALLLAALAATFALRAAVRSRRRRLALMLDEARQAGIDEAGRAYGSARRTGEQTPVGR